MVSKHVDPAVVELIDSIQFGAIPKSSTLHALISMLHTWTQATDGTGSAVGVVLLDYKKAFDLMDHSLLATKVISLHSSWDCSMGL